MKRKKGSEVLLLSERFLLTFVKHKFVGMTTTSHLFDEEKEGVFIFSRNRREAVSASRAGFFFRNVLLFHVQERRPTLHRKQVSTKC